MAVKQHIPNLLTLAGLGCGAAACALSFPHAGMSAAHMQWAAVFIFAAALFDVLDGLAARALHASSEMGQLLDSLADLVSFGLAPGLLLFSMLSNYFYAPAAATDPTIWTAVSWVARLSCLLLPLAAAWRLARFSADTTPRPYFQGLPAPANGLFVASLAMLFYVERASLAPMILVPDSALLSYTLSKPANVAVLNTLLAILMTSRFRMLSFKFSGFTWQRYRWHIVFLLVAVLLVLWLGWLAALPIAFTYLLTSFLARNTYAHE